MKLPTSQLKSEDLESLFKDSSIMEQYFFPRKVPSVPYFDSPGENKNHLTPPSTIQGLANEDTMEKN